MVRRVGWILLIVVAVSVVDSVLAGTGGVSDDLTERLAGDSDSMESVLGPQETEDLVDAALRRVKEKAKKAVKIAKLAELKALASKVEYKELIHNASEYLSNIEDLKAKLATLATKEVQDSKDAVKAGEIAAKMRQIAAREQSGLQETKGQASDIQARLASARAISSTANNRKERLLKIRNNAEERARAAAKYLTYVDTSISKLLDRRSHFKEMEAAEDRTASTSLVRAFQEDADRRAPPLLPP
eukprot:CAMPEP_0172167310 /NCGR_PEP_ID=MMETSP1050-20130122/9499_1 /TAXON_ID=233186 /ORGANISM="Cryptomonas curvata, Strain CCAP979/52" /LENGTH=243 /DNA_ID=CAMNT_0012838083 /DNA_START=51 /DNA_END=779 /DNA_ORIENTATION=+